MVLIFREKLNIGNFLCISEKKSDFPCDRNVLVFRKKKKKKKKKKLCSLNFFFPAANILIVLTFFTLRL